MRTTGLWDDIIDQLNAQASMTRLGFRRPPPAPAFEPISINQKFEGPARGKPADSEAASPWRAVADELNAEAARNRIGFRIPAVNV